MKKRISLYLVIFYQILGLQTSFLGTSIPIENGLIERFYVL